MAQTASKRRAAAGGYQKPDDNVHQAWGIYPISIAIILKALKQLWDGKFDSCFFAGISTINNQQSSLRKHPPSASTFGGTLSFQNHATVSWWQSCEKDPTTLFPRVFHQISRFQQACGSHSYLPPPGDLYLLQNFRPCSRMRMRMPAAILPEIGSSQNSGCSPNPEWPPSAAQWALYLKVDKPVVLSITKLYSMPSKFMYHIDLIIKLIIKQMIFQSYFFLPCCWAHQDTNRPHTSREQTALFFKYIIYGFAIKWPFHLIIGFSIKASALGYLTEVVAGLQTHGHLKIVIKNPYPTSIFHSLFFVIWVLDTCMSYRQRAKQFNIPMSIQITRV